MSEAQSMRPVRRAVNYLNQNKGRKGRHGDGLTAPQRRRIRHKNNRNLGMETRTVKGSGIRSFVGARNVTDKVQDVHL